MANIEYVRVTDDVKPRREYSVPVAAFQEGVHKKLDKPGAAVDGSPFPPKYTPEALGQSGGYDSQKVAELEAEIAARNEGRAEGDLIVVGGAGNKADLIAALESDDA